MTFLYPFWHWAVLLGGNTWLCVACVGRLVSCVQWAGEKHLFDFETFPPPLMWGGGKTVPRWHSPPRLITMHRACSSACSALRSWTQMVISVAEIGFFLFFFNVQCIFLFSLLQLPAVPQAKTWKLAGFHRAINRSVLSDSLSFSLKCCFCRFSTNTFISSQLTHFQPSPYVPMICVFNVRAAEDASMEWMMMRLMRHQMGSRHSSAWLRSSWSKPLLMFAQRSDN